MWLIMFLYLKYIVVCEFVCVVSRWSSFLSLSLSCFLFLCCIHHALSFCSVWWYLLPVKVLWALKICKLSTLEYFQVLFDVMMYFFRGKKDRMDDLMVELTLDADRLNHWMRECVYDTSRIVSTGQAKPVDRLAHSLDRLGILTPRTFLLKFISFVLLRQGL